MMTSLTRFFCLAASGLLLLTATSCDPLQSEAPIGSEPIALVPDDWEGTWIMEESDGYVFTLTVTDPQEGKLILTDWGREILEEPVLVSLRSFGNWKFMNLGELSEGDEEPSEFLFCRFLRMDDRLVIWLADDSSIESLMERGELPTAAGDQEILGKLNEEQLKRLTRDPEEGLFAIEGWSFIRVNPEALP